MNSDQPFGAAQLAAMRSDILAQGLALDRFLARDADSPTCGLNLACAWPFPEELRAAYEQMAKRLSALGPWLYVYPLPFTHVTLVTLVSFTKYIRATSESVDGLARKADEILETLAPLFAEASPERIKSFTLRPQAPVLARAAALLPMLNPGGEVARLRARVGELLRGNGPLYQELVERGLNIPGIIHSTVMRFTAPPPDLNAFLAAFDEIGAETKFPEISVSELLMTSEIKPYMRAGKALRRIRLVA